MLATQWAYSFTSTTLPTPFHTGTKGGRKLSGMWRSTFKIGADHLHSVIETASKSTFLHENRSYIRYGLRVRVRSFGIVRIYRSPNCWLCSSNKHVTKLTLRQLMFVNMQFSLHTFSLRWISKYITSYHLVRTQENEGQIHLQNERVGIIAKKFGRTPIHFVIDVFTTVDADQIKKRDFPVGIKRQQQNNRKIRSEHSSSLKWVHRSIPNLPLPIKNVYCTLSRHATAVVISPLWYAHTASRICSRTNRASSPPLPPWEKSSHF